MRPKEINEDEHDAMMSMALGSAINKLLHGESVSTAGAALGLALGEWLAGVTTDTADQEKILDRVLQLTAQAQNVYAK